MVALRISSKLVLIPQPVAPLNQGLLNYPGIANVALDKLETRMFLEYLDVIQISRANVVDENLSKVFIGQSLRRMRPYKRQPTCN